MSSKQRVLVIALACIALALAAFSFGYMAAERAAPHDRKGDGVESSDGLQEIRDAYEKILSSSVDPPSEEELVTGAVDGMQKVAAREETPDEGDLVSGAIRGMIRALKSAEDPYALFYSPEDYEAFQEYSEGEFGGIGVWLRPEGKRLVIVSVLNGTPAQDVGLHVGDVITAVDGEPVDGVDLDSAIARIKGEAGTEVALDVERDGDVLSFDITRAQIELPNVRGRMLRSDLGYVRLFGFGRGAGAQLKDKVSLLLERGADGIILDLRDNGGGLFLEAIEVASVFIEEGEIVLYKSKAGTQDYEAQGDALEDVPLVVLVNQGSASASEIVAGALQDHDRATLVGMTTFGKGSVQEVLTLDQGSALKVTTAAYLTPEGHDIDGVGVSPDLEVDAGPRVQLRRAMGALLRTISADG